MGNVCECIIHKPNASSIAKSPSLSIHSSKKKLTQPQKTHLKLTTDITSIQHQSQCEIAKSNSPTKLEIADDSSPTQKINKEVAFGNSPKRFSLRDFFMLAVIGKGTFGEVYLVKRKSDDKLLALKKMRKTEINTANLQNLLNEKKISVKAQHPFIMKLRFCFQDSTNVYLGMTYMGGGDLFRYLHLYKRFSEDVTRFYAAQVILGIEYLHTSLNVIYRDLKPENLLIDLEGNLKICDFGLSKIDKEMAYSMCGTQEYLAPEIIEKIGHSKKVDFWALGCLIYELIAGVPPFRSNNQNVLFQLIKTCDYSFPSFFSPEAKSLISVLLQKNPDDRLGVRGYLEIKSHPFFSSIDWDLLLQKKLKPPLTITSPPKYKKISKLQHSASTITEHQPHIHYKGFSYNGEDANGNTPTNQILLIKPQCNDNNNKTC